MGKKNLKIFDIQGDKKRSQYTNQYVNDVRGVITAVTHNGFFLQDPWGDNNLNTSDGIFVYCRNNQFKKGDRVLVSGFVNEYRPFRSQYDLTTTQISAKKIVYWKSSTTIPTPKPYKIIFDQIPKKREQIIEWMEKREGMLVETTTLKCRDGLTKRRNSHETFVSWPNNNSINLKLNFSIQLNKSNTIERFKNLKIDDEFNKVQGVLFYSFSHFEINVINEVKVTSSNYKFESQTILDNSGLLILSFNVKNLNAVNKKHMELVQNFISKLQPTVAILQEVYDSPSDRKTIEELSKGINSQQSPKNHYYKYLKCLYNNAGYAKPVILYNAKQVQPILNSHDVIKDIPGNQSFKNFRKFPYVDFKYLGKKETVFTVINTHLISLRRNIPQWGNQKPSRLPSLKRRMKQARAINSFVNTRLKENPNALIICGGDFNDNMTSPAIHCLTYTPNNKQILFPIKNDSDIEPYTHIYAGNRYLLDNIFVTKKLIENSKIDVIHGCVGHTQKRHISDHNPVLAKIVFPGE